MDLYLSTPDINYPILRLESQNKIWEMGIYPTMYGTRVSCGKIGSHTYLKGGYCCGISPTLLMEVAIAVSIILSSFPESATMNEVDSVLPGWNLRPINRDDGINELRQCVLDRVSLPEVKKPGKDYKKIGSKAPHFRAAFY
jgi:hypothetical protein